MYIQRWCPVNWNISKVLTLVWAPHDLSMMPQAFPHACKVRALGSTWDLPSKLQTCCYSCPCAQEITGHDRSNQNAARCTETPGKLLLSSTSYSCLPWKTQMVYWAKGCPCRPPCQSQFCFVPVSSIFTTAPSEGCSKASPHSYLKHFSN